MTAAFFRDALSIHIVGCYIAWLKSLREYIMFILYLCARIFAYVRMRLRLLRFFSNFSCPFFTHTYIDAFTHIQMHIHFLLVRFPYCFLSKMCACARERERENILFVWKTAISLKMCDLLEICWDGHWFRDFFPLLLIINNRLLICPYVELTSSILFRSARFRLVKQIKISLCYSAHSILFITYVCVSLSRNSNSFTYKLDC